MVSSMGVVVESRTCCVRDRILKRSSASSFTAMAGRHNCIVTALTIAALSIAAAGCAAFRPKTPLPLEQVVYMSRHRVAPEEIIHRIRVSETTYAIRGSQFAALRDAGVSPPVLDEIQSAYIALLTQNVHACGRCQPQKVALDFLESTR
jgi:hypothetical protein